MENNIHILVVEDSPTQAIELQYLLEKNHFQVTAANNGRQALEMLQQITPTIIISDIVMPEMNGYELCIAIKENDHLKDIPVILLTSLSDPEDVINGLSSGANNFIVKPYDEQFLLSRIRYILANMEIRKTASSQMGIEIIFRDKRYFLNSERVQMIDLLLSTYEAAIQRNLDFQITNEKLKQSQEELESRVQERTAELTAANAMLLKEIEERKQAEKRDRLGREVLDRLNRHERDSDLIRDILMLVKDSTGLEAIGIRLQEGEDFPYYETNGFPEDFVQDERFLCRRDDAGKIVYDKENNPELECMCGNIICGRTDPALPFFTKGGSFWTNSSTDLLAKSAEEDRQVQTRNRCNGEGYESVALIPLHADDKIIGLFQLNDSRPNCFTEEMIRFFEGIGASIGIALARNRSEASLKESEEKYKRLVEGSPDIIWVFSDKHGTIFVSSRGEGVLGYSSEYFCKNPWSWNTSIHKDDQDRVAQAIENFAAGKDLDIQYRIKDASGNWKWFNDRSIGRRKIGDETIIEGISTDITERRVLEEQLRQSQKMEAIGTLAGGIAHDFNNILTTIIGNAQLALMDVDEEGSLREEIEEIRSAGERAASLTRQLLTFSRKQIVEPRILNLNELLADMEKMLGRLIGEDVDLLMIQRPDLWLVNADPSQIEQIIMNLSVNAKDAMPGGGKLTIETANVDLDDSYFRNHGIIEEQPGSYVLLAVSDTGTGMDKNTQEHIFDPFFTTKGIGKGTGLGLSTVYGIVKQNNGLIWAYSEPGQGSTFKIYLPKAEGDVLSEKNGLSREIALGGSETILVVEDDVSLRKLTRTVLEKYGYTVLEAEDGDDALRLVKSHHGSIDLMITDVVMPKMGGKEVAKQLQPLYPDMKMIYMSGYPDDAIAHHGILETGLNFIQKPFSPKVLAHKVRDILNAK